MTDGDRSAEQPLLLRTAHLALLATIFSLGFMQPAPHIAGLKMSPTDFVFPLLCVLWAANVMAGNVRIRWNAAFGPVLIYLAALAVTILPSPAPVIGGIKMATQLYLAALTFFVATLVSSRDALRRCVLAWLAATGVIVAVCLVTLALFYGDPHNPVLRRTIYQFGSLTPGHYPRVRLTFANANMLCNYLSVSLLIALAAYRLGWLARGVSLSLLAGITLSALLTLSPGLGGVLLVSGVWAWLSLRDRQPKRARLALFLGVLAGLAVIPAMAVTPILHPTAPYLIHPPGTNLTLAPAGRLMTWTAAAREVLAHPVLGHGFGIGAVHVDYVNPSGNLEHLTDAHNTFLNIAAQCGLVGLAAMIFLLADVLRRTRPLRLLDGDRNLLRLALGIAFLGAFAYQGLGGSFENARHLWVLLGLFLAAARVELFRSARAESAVLGVSPPRATRADRLDFRRRSVSAVDPWPTFT